MKIYTRIEWEWDGKLYRPVKTESFDYHGPVALMKSDALGLGDFIDTQNNHFQNIADDYQKNPERFVIPSATTYESKFWSAVTGKEYKPLVGDVITEGSDKTAYDRQTAQQKGIDTGSADFADGLARTIMTFYGGSALGGAIGGAGEGATVSGTSGAETLGGSTATDTLGTTVATDAPASTSLAESTGGVQTSGQDYLTSQSTPPPTTGTPDVNAPTGGSTPASVDTGGVPDTGSGAPTSDTTVAEQNFVNGAQQQAGSQGLIQNMLDWAKANPTLAVGSAGLGLSAVKGAGDYFAQKDAAKRKTESEKELLDKKAEEEMRLAEFRRQFVQGGSYYNAKIPFSANSAKPLLRPDGTPVYNQNGGLISTAMNR